MSKFSVTGQESGASDLGAITPVNGEYLLPFGNSPNDVLKRHRAAQDGVDLFPSNRIMEAGNRFEGVIREWFEDDFDCKVMHPKIGYRNEHCNLVASLDGMIETGISITDYQGTHHNLSGRGVVDFKHPIRPPDDPEGLSYVFQVQGQMDCAEANWGILAYLPRTTSEWIIVVVPRHQPTIKAIHDAVNVFWDHMENDTDYLPVTNKEANSHYKSNHFAPIDLTDGPTEEIKSEARNHLIEAADTFLSAQRAVKAGEKCMEDNKLLMKHIMGGVDKVILPGDRTISFSERNYKAQPEKVVPAKKAYTTRTFSVKEK